ncbi:hypothetical protein Tco_1289493, partial [Tanacetum coccineum]
MGVLQYVFTVRAYFVCGSLNHLIRDCDFHEKRMARKAKLNNKLSKNSGQREIRPLWNNVQRINKQNQFVPVAVLTRTGKIPVNTAKASGTKNVSSARQSFNNQAVLTSTAMKVNTDYPHRALKNKRIVDSGCFRHKTGNKAYLAEFQDFNGGPVAFGGSKGYITALISLLTTITLSTIMAILDSCPKHNMVAYLEKSEGNAENITAKVAGKPVSISKASIRSDLLFDDANRIDSLPNQAVFDAIQLIG